MRRFVLQLTLGLGLAGLFFANALHAAGSADAASGEAQQTSMQLATSAPKGSLKDPYIGNSQAIAQGGMLFSGAGCPGCHGGGGGGGICPPLTNGVWIYGDSNDTLFRLIALGSVDLQKQGYSRMAIENVVAPMPSFGSIIPKPDDIWKIIAWIKSHYDAQGKPLQQ
ncbi:MAG TPA: c-type cytochrome [Alphaproteobacteria bacterium]|nr:c-type cytochrome [Alphaproteobacteria bacterium]